MLDTSRDNSISCSKCDVVMYEFDLATGKLWKCWKCGLKIGANSTLSRYGMGRYDSEPPFINKTKTCVEQF